MKAITKKTYDLTGITEEEARWLLVLINQSHTDKESADEKRIRETFIDSLREILSYTLSRG